MANPTSHGLRMFFSLFLPRKVLEERVSERLGLAGLLNVHIDLASSVRPHAVLIANASVAMDTLDKVNVGNGADPNLVCQRQKGRDTQSMEKANSQHLVLFLLLMSFLCLSVLLRALNSSDNINRSSCA